MSLLERGPAGEKFVNEIAFNSFMKYWCYPSPKDENGNKKEFCDLLILFSNTIIIISVKNYEFKGIYLRYFNNTIAKAVKQIYGSERKLFSSTREIYIKHPDKDLEIFPKKEVKKVFRIIVNLGEGVMFYPFNTVTINNKFISLFDKKSFETIIKELDTLPDFIEYLSKRELFFKDKLVTVLPGEETDYPPETSSQFMHYSNNQFGRDGKQSILISGTEQDLLATYLKHNRVFPEAFDSPDSSGMLIQLDGTWEEYLKRSEVQLKKISDKASYFIDELVKREILPKMSSYSEEIAKELLSFNRFQRRMISNVFLEFYDKYKNIRGSNIARRYSDIEGTGIVLVFYSPEMSNEMVDTLLRLSLESFSVYSNYKSKKMILIATTSNSKQFRLSLVKDIQPFPEQIEQQIKQDVKTLGWFTNHTEIQVNEKEYPDE